MGVLYPNCCTDGGEIWRGGGDLWSPPPRQISTPCITGFSGLSTHGLNGLRCRPTRRTTVSRPPVLTLGGSCVPPTVNCLQYHVTGSIHMVAWPFQWLAPQSGTLFRILSGTRPSVQTVSEACLRRTCLLDTSALSALEVL